MQWPLHVILGLYNWTCHKGEAFLGLHRQVLPLCNKQVDLVETCIAVIGCVCTVHVCQPQQLLFLIKPARRLRVIGW